MQEKKTYNVAGHVFSLYMDGEDRLFNTLDNYSPFECADGGEEVFSLAVTDGLDVSGKKAFFISDPPEGEQRIDLYYLGDDYLFELAPMGDMEVCGFLKVSGDFTTGILKAPRARRFCVNNALMLMYAFRTAVLGTMEMHASVTVKDGRGFLFLGKSGTGKSTHSRLWLKNIPGSRLLNDDNPIVRVVGGEVRVFGSPWSGKTPCYINEDYPVGAFVRINRAPYDAIHRMGLPESFASLSSSTSGLRAIRSIADGLFNTVSTVAQTVPCYILDCLPDDEAAIVCSTEVLKNV
ncbi:MAG: hypothetical protein IK076_04480 [Bacteroidales bacterium]|nr:hypothetical protein [Bacteroidales bacterium]